MINPKLLVPLVVSLLSGCATLSGHLTNEWQCVGTATVGGVVATSFRNVSPGGTVGASGRSWEWRQTADKANISIMQPGFEDNRPWIVVDLKKPIARRIFGIELRAGDGLTAVSDPSLAIHRQQEQYILTPTLQTLLSLPRPVSVVGYDGQGRPAIRIPLDLDVIARGEEALMKADALLLEATRDYERACRRLTDEPLIIA